MADPTYQLSASTIASVRAALDAKNYPAAYQAIANDLLAQNAAAMQAGPGPLMRN
jgi:hypothetical protein